MVKVKIEFEVVADNAVSLDEIGVVMESLMMEWIREYIRDGKIKKDLGDIRCS